MSKQLPWETIESNCSNLVHIETSDTHVTVCSLPKKHIAIAEFIVRACNAHAELLAALQDLTAFVAVMCGVGPDAVIPETIRTRLGVDVKVGEIMRDASAALAQAEPSDDRAALTGQETA